jgi:uncharacterized protein
MNMDFMKGDEGKKLLQGIGFVLFVLAIFLIAQTLNAFRDLRSPNLNYSTIAVTGEGEVLSIPDLATFSFSVSADSKDVSSGQEQVTSKMNSILEGLKSLGIDEKDIKTGDYSVWPKYTYTQVECFAAPCPPTRQVPDGYTVSHTVIVKVRDIAKSGQALALVGEKGGTNISGLTFTTDDPDALYTDARAEAIADAKAKAKVLSKQLGVKLVRVVDYYDNSQGQPMPYGGYAMDSAVKAQSAAPTLPTGENKTKVTVTVRYEIR